MKLFKISKYQKTAGTALIIIGAVLLTFTLYHNSQKRQQAILFSPRFMLSVLWESYKKNYWESSTGRTVDHQRDGITTSEGQSYTMLRAVWGDDKATFDKSWQWTKTILKRSDSNLFSWIFGKNSDGTWGVLHDQGGQNTATDADTDIALALVFAAKRWSDPAYMDEAKRIITDIWNQEVVLINGKPYVAANNLEKQSPNKILVNPSYLAPYAYRIFAELDPEHDWLAAVSTSYEILNQSSAASLNKNSSNGLPPDWVEVSRTDGRLNTPGNVSLTTNYGYDAMRAPFRVALDYQWNGDPRAKAFLDRLNFLGQEWQSKKILFSVYSHDGNSVSNQEAPAMYATALGYFLASHPDLAEDVYKNKLLVLYSPDFQDWKKPLGYYDDNWAWFGIALYHKELNNLFNS